MGISMIHLFAIKYADYIIDRYTPLRMASLLHTRW